MTRSDTSWPPGWACGWGPKLGLGAPDLAGFLTGDAAARRRIGAALPLVGALGVLVSVLLLASTVASAAA